MCITITSLDINLPSFPENVDFHVILLQDVLTLPLH